MAGAGAARRAARGDCVACADSAAPIPADALPYWLDYSIDWRVLAALIGVSALTVLVFALVPALQASKTDVDRGVEGWRTLGLAGPAPHPGDRVPRGADRAVRRAAGTLRGNVARPEQAPGLGHHLRSQRYPHGVGHAPCGVLPDAGGPGRVLRHPDRADPQAAGHRWGRRDDGVAGLWRRVAAVHYRRQRNDRRACGADRGGHCHDTRLLPGTGPGTPPRTHAAGQRWRSRPDERHRQRAPRGNGVSRGKRARPADSHSARRTSARAPPRAG